MGEQEACSRCGGAARRPTNLLEWVRAWFNDGAPGADMVRCRQCGAAWSAGGGGYWLASSPGLSWQHPFRSLDRLSTAIRGGRNWQPVPRFYAIIGGIAVAPAALVAVFLPRHRLLVLVGLPLAVMVGGFLWSFASVLNPNERRRMGRDIAFRVNPRKATARELDEEITLIREAAPSFRLLVPAHWDGELAFGGCSRSWSPGQPERVTEILVMADHDPQAPDQPAVWTRTSIEPVEPPDDHHARTLAFLERRTNPPSQSHSPADADAADPDAAWREEEDRTARRIAELADAWTDGELVVDGRPVPARVLVGDGAAVALLDLDGQQITLEAIGVPLDGLTLTALADPEPLLEAFRHRRGWAALIQ